MVKTKTRFFIFYFCFTHKQQKRPLPLPPPPPVFFTQGAPRLCILLFTYINNLFYPVTYPCIVFTKTYIDYLFIIIINVYICGVCVRVCVRACVCVCVFMYVCVCVCALYNIFYLLFNFDWYGYFKFISTNILFSN